LSTGTPHAPDYSLNGAEHVRRYEETGGAVGHDWNGASVLLLRTTGRRSGLVRTSPLVYGQHAGDYVVVASNGGSGVTPAWLHNLEARGDAEVQVRTAVVAVRGEVVTGPDRDPLWATMLEVWPRYGRYEARAGGDLPVVRLTPRTNSGGR
jgi:deazaflavin-dependent oxidoreductase (nitroreductase family)